MKVRCVKLFDSLGQPVERSSWARLDGLYHVLSIWIEPTRTRFRMVGEEPTPALFEPEMFVVVSSTIPPNWVVKSPEPGLLSIGPESWGEVGFWERFFDGEPAAVAAFKVEQAKTIAADP